MTTSKTSFDIDTLKKLLEQNLNQINLTLNEHQINQLIQYISLLYRWNQTYNLTAIRDIEKMIAYHLIDSLAVLSHLKNNNITKLADIGTGAGLPAYPLAIANPEMKVFLVEANHKRIAFLRQVVIELKLDNVEIVHCRVELAKLSAQPDGIISRAFSEIKEFISLSKHLGGENCKFFAMKGVYPYEEIASLPEGFVSQEVIELNVPNVDGARHLAIINKTKS